LFEKVIITGNKRSNRKPGVVGGKANSNAHSTIEYFIILSSINLLNAAIKRPEYNKVLEYATIKGKVTRLLYHLSNLKAEKIDLDFYVNKAEHCAYIEIFSLQFSFHNIAFNETLEEFVNSNRNKVKPWTEIRLQRIAGELFRLALKYEKEVG
jgi:hypothetical protein